LPNWIDIENSIFLENLNVELDGGVEKSVEVAYIIRPNCLTCISEIALSKGKNVLYNTVQIQGKLK